jgi:hypothetical protein
MTPVPPILVLGLGAFLVVFLVLLALRPAPRVRRGPDETELAKRYIDRQIEAHLDELVRHYEEIEAAGGRTERFADVIESFIGEVVMQHRITAEDDEAELPVREVVVLEREYIYHRILTRIGSPAADPS